MDDNELNKKEEMKKKHTALKVTFIIISILVVLIIIAGVIGYIFICKNKQEIVEKNSQAIVDTQEIIEYGTKLKYEDILQKLVKADELYNDTNISILMNEKLINKDEEYTFDTVDEIKIVVETQNEIIPFLNQETVVKKEITWKVEDTKKPVLSGVQDKEITIGEEVDIKAGMSAKDEVDGELEVTVEGEFDITKAGEYILKAKAVDKNGNETTQEFKLIVKEKQEEVIPQDSNNSNASTPPNANNTTSKNTSNKTSGSNTSNNTSSNGTSSGNTNQNGGTSSTPTGGNNNSSGGTSTNTPTDPTSTKEGRLSLAKAEASRVVSRIITAGMTKLQKAEAICNYITTTVDVQTNQSNEAYKTNYGNEAYAALVMKIAACSGRCKAVTLLCDAAGLKSQHINAGQWTHQWNKIQIDDGSWVVVDSQIGFVGDKHPLE